MDYAILADRVHYGLSSIDNLMNTGKELADKVEARGKSVDVKINDAIYVTKQMTNHCIVVYDDGEAESLATCYDFYVHDDLEGEIYSYRYSIEGPSNGTFAYRKETSLQEAYKVDMKSEDFDKILKDLITNC